MKIITRALAKRLAKVIGKLIDRSQKGLPGRHITINLNILQDLVDYINNNDLQCALIFLDQEKAFDRMPHSFMIKTLRHFGFGEYFIKWINIIYSDCSSRVKVNGFTTHSFPIERGVRQGCPLSSLLYALCLESLCLEIKNNQKITKFQDNEHKDLEFADDMSIAITDMESIEEIFVTLNRFEKATNAKINVEKTEALWVGNWKKIWKNQKI